MKTFNLLVLGLVLATLCPSCDSHAGTDVESDMVLDGTFEVKAMKLSKCPNELFTSVNPCQVSDEVEYCVGGTITILDGILDLTNVEVTSEGIDLILVYSAADAVPDYNSYHNKRVDSFTWKEVGGQEVCFSRKGGGCSSIITIQ